MAEIVLSSCSGGIINQVLVDDLRGDKVAGDAKPLADVANFIDADSESPTASTYETDFNLAYGQAKAAWAALDDELAAVEPLETSRLRDKLVLPLLRSFGFDPQFQRAHLPSGDGAYRISHLGWDGFDAPPVIVEPGDLDRASGARRSAHDELQGYLNGAPADWGIVTNGLQLRILRDFHHTRTKGYVQFDLAAILTADSLDDFRALYRLCHASRFRARLDPDTGDHASESEPQAHCLLEDLHQKSLSAGVSAGKRLKPQIRRAIEQLANGALDSNAELRARMVAEADFGRTLYSELLSVLYRTLFLLFAEQRDMLAGASALYRDTYSLSSLRQTAEERAYEGRRLDLWEGLKGTFRAFHDPQLADALGVYPFNGDLFDPAHTPHLTSAAIPNTNLADAIRSLTTVEVGKVSLHVDYRNLGVEELGTVYESLLDYTLRIADEPTAVEGRTIRTGQAYLNPFSTERGDLASYYTPPALVSLTLDRSLDPLIEARLDNAGPDPALREAALLDLRIIDAACGSAAFLVAAVDRVALAVARERTSPAEPSDSEVGLARRDVLSRCIYGADKDPFAVELAKVALWIHCAIPDAPLSFLDHHIVCGDSLVGWPLLDPPTEIERDAFAVPDDKVDKDTAKILKAAKNANNEYLDGVRTLFGGSEPPVPDTSAVTLPTLLTETKDSSWETVRAKAAAFEEYQRSDELRRAKRLADLWTAAHFWTADSGTAPTTRDYHHAINSNAATDLVDAAADIAYDLNPLHWSLAFPDVRDRSGFDLVIGNPPWEQFESGEIEFFRDTRPDIAGMTTEHRKSAIADLAESSPSLHGRWIRYKSAQDRMSHWAKTSGRFVRTSGKVNTYVLFAELAADLVGSRGQSGVIVKSGIACDLGPSPLWQRLVDSGRVRELVDIINEGPGGAKVFEDVAPIERFCVLVLGAPRVGTTRFGATLLNRGVEAAASASLASWSRELLEICCPETRTMPSPASPAQAALLEELHRRNTTLDFDRNSSPNPWGIKFDTIFNSSTMKEMKSQWGEPAKRRLALRRESLEDDGWCLEEDGSMSDPNGRRALPVYEGQMINLWDHRARTFEGFEGADKYGRKPHLPWVMTEQHEDPQFEVEPRYWVHEHDVVRRLDEIGVDEHHWLVAFRDVGVVWTNRRSMKSCLFPKVAATDTIAVFTVSSTTALSFLALVNATTFDFVLRSHMPGGHVNKWVLSQCAAPLPSELPATVGKLAERLSVTSQSLATSYGMPITPWDEEQRAQDMATLDVHVARAYGLDRDEYLVVLDHFEQLHRLETKELGEARTRRLCLKAWDRIEKEGS